MKIERNRINAIKVLIEQHSLGGSKILTLQFRDFMVRPGPSTPPSETMELSRLVFDFLMITVVLEMSAVTLKHQF